MSLLEYKKTVSWMDEGKLRSELDSLNNLRWTSDEIKSKIIIVLGMINLR